MGVVDREPEGHAVGDGAKRSRSFIAPGFRVGFALVASLFFLWAIANSFNDILIRQFQKALELDRAEAGFIQFVFYLAYFLLALPAGLLLRRFGYRAGILAGLALYACGALLFYPAAELRTYGYFLLALFVLASGAAVLETAANPYVTFFGDRGRAAQRLNLAQSFNGFGAVLAPTLGGLFIFSGIEHGPDAIAAMPAAELVAYRADEARMVQMPYLVLAGAVLLVAIAIALVRLPDVDQETQQSPAKGGGLIGLLRIPSLAGAVAAQFCYVAAQVGIWSFFVDFVKDAVPATPERTAAYLLSVSLLLFMVGRFTGTALMQRVAPARLLQVYGLAAAVLCVLAWLSDGWVAVGALGLTSFFMSIMFPTIFSLGVRDLGSGAPLGSSLIIMSIIGGALLPPLMGFAAEASSLHLAMLLPALCFLAVTAYGMFELRRAGEIVTARAAD